VRSLGNTVYWLERRACRDAVAVQKINVLSTGRTTTAVCIVCELCTNACVSCQTVFFTMLS
jgi:formate hydrogenlyase subunit 6/NADH:ubiquinone oxidoreductase subunit I